MLEKFVRCKFEAIDGFQSSQTKLNIINNEILTINRTIGHTFSP